MSPTFRLPDTLARWPYARRLNTAYEEIKHESSNWLESFNAFSPKAQSAFDKCDFSSSTSYIPKEDSAHTNIIVDLLASLGYPNAPPRKPDQPTRLSNSLARTDHLRSACDLMNLFFVFDEYTDAGTAADVQILSDIVIDALHHPDIPRPQGENVIGEITRQSGSLHPRQVQIAD
jgi:hypothetical protein